MEKVLLFAILVTVLFGVLKLIEIRFIEKENKSPKYAIRDLLMAFCSSFISATLFIQYSSYLDDFLSIITDTKSLHERRTQIFTGTPDF